MIPHLTTLRSALHLSSGLQWSVRRAALLMLLATAFGLQAQVLPRLPALAANPQQVTVSGLSSGGYMAAQFAMAYSASVSGVAVLAGGPYGCSGGSVNTASLNCSCPANPPWWLQVQQLWGGGCQTLAPSVYADRSIKAVRGNQGQIDDLSHLQRQRVWLFSGGKDKVVPAPLVMALKTTYQRLGVPAAQIRHEEKGNAGHGFPSLAATESCSITAPPFITQCQFDAAGELLKWLHPDLKTATPAVVDAGAFKRFDQSRYGSAGEFNSLDATGWLYLPRACEQAGAKCAVHVVFHGCEQGQSFKVVGKEYGRQFVDGTGYNRWAEAGKIVVLYPQIKPNEQGSLIDPYRYNPKGCWDFWGYTEKSAALTPSAPKFAQRSAPQMRAVKAMVEDLLRGM
jgi:pimeloyl-ACP methyl ester carboxylesterase